jgi:hypothetical protein
MPPSRFRDDERTRRAAAPWRRARPNGRDARGGGETTSGGARGPVRADGAFHSGAVGAASAAGNGPFLAVPDTKMRLLRKSPPRPRISPAGRVVWRAARI